MKLERNSVLWAFTKQPNNKFEKYYSQLDGLKIAIEQNHSELANGKDIVFHQGNARPPVSLSTRQ